ncbi:MAG: LLM class flavin-dependent oxidoreductase [Gammaproteobacteria bacterium]|nr:LLM class flavin-dependent oxidoreductase [Gammaproteobacteria bacterium]MCP5199555.1 LLM class flavin-dependent oxidoreductase [Gammaproteobacteria bacterium]
MEPRELALGLLLPSWTGAMDGVTPRVREVVEIARLAEAVGFDSVWMSDHLYYEPHTDFRVVGVELPDEFAGVKNGQWECFSVLNAVAAVTTRVTLGTLVANTGFRNPALLARMAATLDDFSDGRVILGLGAGDFVTEHRALGYPFERRVSRFEEALAIIRPLLRGETVDFTGEFQRCEQAALLPPAARAGGPPIMIGSLEGRPRMSRLVATHADLWNTMLAFGGSDLTTWQRAWAPIAAACERHGRDPASLARHATVGVDLGDSPYPIPGATPLAGSPAAIAEALAAFATAGVGHVSIMPHPWTRGGLERFARVIECLRA